MQIQSLITKQLATKTLNPPLNIINQHIFFRTTTNGD